MDTDIPGDSGRNMPVDVTGCREHECGNVALTRDSIPELSYLSNVHVDITTDTGDITKREQGSTPTVKPHPSELTHSVSSFLPAYIQCSQGHSHIQPARDQINHEHYRRNSQGASEKIVLPAPSEEMHLSDLLPVIPAIETGSAVHVSSNGMEVPALSHSQEPLLCSLTTPKRKSHDDGEGRVDPDGVLDPVQILDTKAGRAHETDGTYLADEEEIREDFDHPYNDFPSSQPPSSSPPQLFSSSPCVSSQSSAGDIETFKMEDVELESAQDCSHADVTELVVQDKSHLASEHLHEQATIRVVTSTESAEHHIEMDPTLGDERPEPSKKRVAYQSDDDQSYGPQPTKRLKSGSHLYPLPAPMRATLASQSRQFKKLAAPFRPPSKLPVTRGEPVQITKNVMESAELNHDKSDQRELSTQVLRPHHKVSNTSRSATQFKSPLLHGVSSADTRTIRLTPALQALERKLQLLKRAVKVKEGNEEEVLARLAVKWTEAGREVAYEVWDATKDAGNFEEKTVLMRRSYGWENADNGNTSWGWHTKREDGGEESRASDSSMAVCAGAEEDGFGFHNNLGTMLRQLGIDPDIFGWNDDKEAFCD